MVQKSNQNRQQNKGFTLIEVLISITILAIIAAPMLHAFVTSARTNAKSAKLLDATTLSQNIMEEFKAGSLEDIAREFNGYGSGSIASKASGGAYEAVETGVDSGTYVAVDKENATLQPSVIDAADPTKYPDGVFVGQKSDEYHFMLSKVEMENSTYDVAIHLAQSGNGEKNLADIYAMDRTDCGYFAQEEDMDRKAAAEFKLRNTAYAYDAVAQKTVDEFWAMMTRHITISIGQTSIEANAEGAGNGNTKKTTYVDVTYEYEIPRGYTTDADRQYSVTTRIYDNQISEEELQAVYLYYYPFYSRGTDTLTIDNQQDLEIDVFVIKMNGDAPENGVSQPQVPTIAVTEGSGRTEGSYVRVCTNLDITSYNRAANTIRVANLGNLKETISQYDVTIEIYSHQDNAADAFGADHLVDTYEGSFLDDSRKING